MSNIAVATNRKARKYSRLEMGKRVFWGFGQSIFRLSPRPCFGFRRWILRCFGAKVGREVHIYPSAIVYFPWNLEIGDESSIGEWALIYNLGRVKVGRRSTISQRVHLCAGTHDYRQPDMPLLKPPSEVGDDCWICADAFVGPNVKVGDFAIVGAAAVLVKDAAPFEIWGGNPAVKIKDRGGVNS